MCFGLVADDGQASALAAVTNQRKNKMLRAASLLLTEVGAGKTPTNPESIKSHGGKCPCS